MTRLMYDSTNPAGIPVGAEIVAGYIDGIYGPDHAKYGQTGWDAAAWARFPNAIKVYIACFASTNDGHVLDVETGDATASQAPGWVLKRRAAGIDPSVYTSYSNWALVRNAFQSAGVAEPHYWIADYDNIATIFNGAIAKQYADPVFTKADYDLSIVADYWPGVDFNMGTVGELDQAWVTDLNARQASFLGVTGSNDVAPITVKNLSDKLDAVSASIAALPAPVTQAEINAAVASAVAALPTPVASVPSLWDVLKATFAAPSK